MSSYLGAMSALMSTILGSKNPTGGSPHRANTSLSQQPHIDPPKPLTKRQLRRQKGRKS